MDGEGKTCVQVDEPDFWDRPAYFYVVAPMENVEGGSFAGVRIDVDIESSRLTSGAERVRDTLKTGHHRVRYQYPGCGKGQRPDHRDYGK